MNLPALTPSNTSLLYLAPGDVLKGRVEPMLWMHTCHSLANIGLPVELVSLYTYRSENISPRDVFRHFAIDPPNFRVTILPTPLTVNSAVWWYRGWVSAFNFIKALALNCSRTFSRSKHNLVFYARGPAAIYPYLFCKPMLSRVARVSYFFETHAMLNGEGARKVLKSVDGVVVNSRKLGQDLQEATGIPSDKIQVAYLASHAVASPLSKSAARERLGLSPTARYAVYTGKLVMEEVRLILETASLLRSSMPDLQFLFVGGNPAILEECQKELADRKLDNVRFTGFVAPADVALYQNAGDILLLYLASSREIIRYITPAKIFDYLQAGRPIIVSDFPILHEIIRDGVDAVFVQPHAPGELAATIQRVLADPGLMQQLSKNALESSQQYSWQSRVELIWSFVQRRSGQQAAALVAQG